MPVNDWSETNDKLMKQKDSSTFFPECRKQEAADSVRLWTMLLAYVTAAGLQTDNTTNDDHDDNNDNNNDKATFHKAR